MKVFLIRHGMTPGNELHQYIGGRTDQHLSEQGKAQLSEIYAEKFYPSSEHVFVSPMIRCHETAEILFPGSEKTVLEGLREMDFGIFEQRSAKDMEDDPVYKEWVDGMCEGPIPDGEVKSEFTKRCCEAFSETMKTLGDDKEKAVFVIHGGTIMAILSEYGKPEKSYYDWYVKNGHGYECEWDGANLHILNIY